MTSTAHADDAVTAGPGPSGGGPQPWEHGLAYVGGAFVTAADARVSIFDHSFLYGDGVFETVVVRNGTTFALAPHLERLASSARYLRIEVPLPLDALEELVEELVRRNELRVGFVRVVLSRGSGYPASDPRKATRPLLVLSVQEQPPVALSGSGLRLVVARTRRTPPSSLDPRAKTNNYGNLIVAKLEAIDAGADDAILLDHEDHVAELPGSNIFVVDGDRLRTPAEGNLLNGITRAAILELVRSGGVSPLSAAIEDVLTPDDLLAADEVFVTSTGSGVARVSAVGGVSIGGGEPGPVTADVAEAYERLVERETRARADRKRVPTAEGGSTW